MLDKGTIKVVCRLRPENAKELSGDYTRCVDFSDEDIAVKVNTVFNSNKIKCETRTGVASSAQQQQEAHSFRLDKIYGPGSEQESLFKEVATPVLDCNASFVNLISCV